jgi:hypothetical protein
MLTGRAAEIIQQRKEQHVATQQRRKEINRQIAKGQDSLAGAENLEYAWS